MPDLYFIYNGLDSRDLGLTLSSYPVFTAAEPDVSAVKIAGKSGEGLYWDGSYKNVTGTIEVFINSSNLEALSMAASLLQYDTGYHKLQVSNEPNIYRMAYIQSGQQTQFRNGVYNAFQITLSCYPQKFLVSGDTAVSVTGSTTLTNSYFDSLPKIVVYGSGSGKITIGSYPVSISSITSGMILDCETMNAYKGTVNLNSKVTAQPYPKLVHGSNAISFSGGVTSLSITPRWWSL